MIYKPPKTIVANCPHRVDAIRIAYAAGISSGFLDPDDERPILVYDRQQESFECLVETILRTIMPNYRKEYAAGAYVHNKIRSEKAGVEYTNLDLSSPLEKVIGRLKSSPAEKIARKSAQGERRIRKLSRKYQQISGLELSMVTWYDDAAIRMLLKPEADAYSTVRALREVDCIRIVNIEDRVEPRRRHELQRQNGRQKYAPRRSARAIHLDCYWQNGHGRVAECRGMKLEIQITNSNFFYEDELGLEKDNPDVSRDTMYSARVEAPHKWGAFRYIIIGDPSLQIPSKFRMEPITLETTQVTSTIVPIGIKGREVDALLIQL